MNDAEGARQFIEDIALTMKRESHRHFRENDIPFPAKDEESMQKRVYGDTWVFFYGIYRGMNLMDHSGRHTEYDFDKREEISHGIDDDSWQEHYDKYGHGEYGRALKIGKRLAVYNGSDFSFVKPEDSSDSQFNFVQ